jgi:hypothetical protein
MDFVNDFWIWAWDRHHNIWSWYLRPLFLLPFCYFAFKRSATGILLTLLALLTSMFWFPKPAEPDPRVVAFLEMEKAYLTQDWTIWKVLLSLLVPLSLSALAMAFWKRSLLYGVIVINAIAIAKTVWSFVFGSALGGLAVLAPAAAGLAVCNAVILLVAWHVRRRSRPRLASAAIIK